MDALTVRQLKKRYKVQIRTDPFRTSPWVLMERTADVVLHYLQGPVVEIGAGASTVVLAKVAQAHAIDLYTCDSNPFICGWVEESVTYPKLHVFRGKSAAFLGQYAGGPPAVVFIDGNHSYSVVKWEVETLLPMMSVGGVMFLHDTCPVEYAYETKIGLGREMDTYKIRKDLERREDIDVLTWRYTAAGCGLTMVLKKDMTEPEYRR